MQAVDRIYDSHDWITMLFVFSFFLLALARILYPQRFVEFINIPNSGKFISFKGKENHAFHGFNILLLLVQAIAISIFLFLGFQAFFQTEEPAGIIFIRIMTGYLCFLLLKTGVEKIIGNIFELDARMDYYIFQKISYRSFVSLFVLLASVFLVYSLQPSRANLLGIGLIVLLSNVIALIIIYRRNQNLLVANWFYFILYLCALEIAPYIILYKLITI
ncbi:MAG: DUF4271 domain-containing protein [Bacteroidota bacterium]|nr:DUF4271 domain-containing protein [Bacteroidota bacterium]